MRALLALALATALTPLAAGAHDLDEAVPYGVVRVDGAAVRQSVLAAQVACRNQAYSSTSQDGGPAASKTTTGGLAIGVIGDWPGAITEPSFVKAEIAECMGQQGFGPAEPSADDRALFRAAVAGGQHADPYAVIVGFAPAAPRVTTVMETQTAAGMVRTYTVGRF